MPPRSVASALAFASTVGVTLVATSVIPARGNLALALARLAWATIVAAAGYRIMRTGRISPARRALFVLTAIGFIATFKTGFLPRDAADHRLAGRLVEAPYCHIAIAADIGAAIHAQYLSIASGQWRIYGPLTLGVMWLLVALVTGPAWCSWICFYGGIDEGFSRLRRRAFFRWDRLVTPWRDLPAAVLLASALLGLATLLPVYCLWVCPLKLTTTLLDTESTSHAIQTVILVSGVAALLVVGPILTRKRLFCTLACPFSAVAAAAGKVHPIGITIDADRCNQCGLCVRVCPTFAISTGDLSGYRVGPWCNRCGECVDACPRDAMAFSSGASSYFIYAMLVLGGTISGLFVPRLCVALVGWVLGH